MLEALNVAPERVREQVMRIVGSDEVGMGDRRPLTPRARRVLESASKEALRLGHDQVDAGHVLLGLVGESEGVAAHVLNRLGLDPDGIHCEVARALDARKTAVGVVGCTPDLPYATTIRARVEGLVVQVRCGVSDEERTAPQPLRVDLRYSYEAGGGDDLERAPWTTGPLSRAWPGFWSGRGFGR